MAARVEEIRKGHQRKRTMEIFELMDKGNTMDQAAEIMKRRRETGENSEAAFVNALQNTPGIGSVRMASKRKDYTRGIDAIVVTKPPLFEGEWEVQIKSNDEDCEEYLVKLKPGYRAKTTEQVKTRMAKNGKMVVDAGKFRNDPKKNEESIRSQFGDWLKLSSKARSGR